MGGAVENSILASGGSTGKLDGMVKVLFIFGTRPEAIKLCPVVLHMRSRASEFETRVCVTGQHRGMLDQVLAAFDVRPDYDLDLMLPGQTLYQSTSRILAALEPVLKAEQPGIVLVQGDTTTTLCGALAAFYSRVPVAHVEAGLRTWDPWRPFPEEMNRVLTGRLRGAEWPQLDSSKKLIVVTAHRRESFGHGFESICTALAELAQRDDVQ